jgi:energy-coupling factor transporter ATP-binding protein EcfA2
MDFFQICTREAKGGVTEIYPDFTVGRSKDLMVRGKAFYAIWDEERRIWSTDEYDVQRLVDQELREHAEKLEAEGHKVKVRYLHSFTSNTWSQFRKFMANVSDNSHQLDESLTFADTETKKNDYVSRRLPYTLDKTDFCPAWDELVGFLYSPEERAKIEWFIGAIVSGDSKKIQKFLVLYGPAGTGKSTILNIVNSLFEGYVTTFEAKTLGANNNSFATEVFGGNPLVAIQHDGDLSKIEDNSKLNSIISHELMTMNAKYKPLWTSRINAVLFMGTNKPVKISDAKSGIIRRLIDVKPTGNKFKANHYNTLMARIEFELGAIAYHCLETYRQMGKNFYNNYRPMEMMLQTDVFFNFVEAHYDIFKEQDGATLKQAYALYKEFCADTGIEFVLPQYKFREELRNYFSDFQDRGVDDKGATVRSYYSGFKSAIYKTPTDDKADVFSLVLGETTSLLDEALADCPAQYAKEDGTPRKYWTDEPRSIAGTMQSPKPDQVVDTVLADIDTTQEHYVKPPKNHIVIDFDLKGDDGGKSLERNLEAASSWPATYAELSKSGRGVHLHYIWTGSTPSSELDANYSDGIEIKTFGGNASLRRARSRCNNVPIAELSSGLPFKEKKVLSASTLQSEKGVRDLIARNLRKEIHPGTKPSIDFIQKVLDDAYKSGMSYDVTDLRGKIVAFANNSTNQAMQCLKTVQQMKFKSADVVEDAPPWEVDLSPKDDRLVFFDVEVYPNLFVVCWKYEGDTECVKMINPSPQEIEGLFQFKLVGFNNRRYDNHILWARFMGYSNEGLYHLSTKIINNTPNVLFGEAYNISYADIYDFSSKKQSLKKFQIDLGILHMELDIPWDKPVADVDIPRVVEYCCNDVLSSEKVFASRRQDFVARQILADLSGLTVNDTTQKHTARIIFGSDRNPQRSFKYTDLSKEFPGYEYDRGKSTYRGELVGEGGYVYAEPGMYSNVAVLDVVSMHPTSIKVLNLFGDYTTGFVGLLDARIAIKHKDYESARKMLGGKLAPYLANPEEADALSYALKIIINIVYGLTSAKFDNPFRDNRNKDNIVAKRGALFMIDLKNAVQARGFTVVHIKTDSIKIPNATPEIIEFVTTFGRKYGYDFEHEVTYDQFCLVNDAVYIARVDECLAPNWVVVDESQDESVYISNIEGKEHPRKWVAVGAQFQHPYVFKTLFSKEEITFEDLCEARSVSQGVMYLDFDSVDKAMFDYERMHHVGRTGLFVPVQSGSGGGVLYRVKDDKPYSVAGTKGHLWLEAEHARGLDSDQIDMTYFYNLAREARTTIEKFGNFDSFVA